MQLNFKHMKFLFVWLAAFAVMTIAGCSTQKVYVDEMYYDLSDVDREFRTREAKNQLAETHKRLSETNNSTYQSTEDGNIVIKNEYYDDSHFAFDDYYDYSYSARIRRFGSQYNTWGYYDPYYTNAYWYNPQPSYWGVSIYQTYGWWGPSPVWPYGYTCPGYMIVYSWGNQWGWNSPYCYNSWGGTSWWNNPWHNTYSYGWWNPYNPWQYSGWNNPWQYAYWNGYNQGYWNGYNNGLAMGGLYYNSFDNNSYYYGPRLTSNNHNSISFAKTMQNQGMDRDIAANRIHNVPVSSVDRNTNQADKQTLTTEPIKTNANIDKSTHSNKDVTIIRNYDDKTGNNKSPVVTDKNTSRSSEQNNNTYRQWNTGGKENINIEKKQPGVQRSGTFTEGSRTYDNNSGFFGNRNTTPQSTPNNNIPKPQNNQGTPNNRPR